MRFTKALFAALWLVAAGCGDDSATGGAGGTSGSSGTSGSGGSGGSGGMIDAPMGTGGTGGMGGMGTGGMGGMRPDASLNDAGANKTTITPNQVQCQGGPCTTPANVCCATLGADGGVSVMCEASATCPMMAPLSLACDGPEDCTGNQVCCGQRAAGGLGFRSSCTTANQCMGMGARPMCHDHTQCPMMTDSCCELSLGGAPAFTGRCYAPGTEPAGSACDTP